MWGHNSNGYNIAISFCIFVVQDEEEMEGWAEYHPDNDQSRENYLDRSSNISQSEKKDLWIIEKYIAGDM